MRVFGPGSVENQPEADGVYRLLDVVTYVVESEAPLPAFPGITRALPGAGGRLTELKLVNYLGEGVLGPLRFRVTSPKLSDDGVDRLLDDIVREATALPFGIDAPAGRGFELESACHEVPFHLLAWLRHVMRDGTDSMPAHFLQVARQPHRRVDSEPFREASWLACDVDPSTLISMVMRPDLLVRLGPDHKLAKTTTARALGGRFPSEVAQQRRFEDFDTHENRLVRATLERARDVVSRFLGYEFRNALLEGELQAIGGSLDWMLTHDFLSDVGPLTRVPLQSSVMQRREGYREFLGHYLALTSGAGVLDLNTARALLDLKKVSLLYELWCFFVVRRCLVEMLGPPQLVSVARVDDTEVSFEAGGGAGWRSTEAFGGEVRLTFNPTYTQPESYSLPMRPDILVEAQGRRLALDAKFRFEDPKPNGVSGALAAKRDDFVKMHAYRDAIRAVVGAYALFPGTQAELYSEKDGWGVGAVPLRPGDGDEALRWVLGVFLSEA